MYLPENVVLLGKKMIDVFKLIGTYEINVKLANHIDALLLRIEIFAQCVEKKSYRARVLRRDMYRILPTIGGRSEKADEDIFVTDLFWWNDEEIFIAENEEDALKFVLQAISDRSR